MRIAVIFFGSTQESVLVASKLHETIIDTNRITIVAVVTQPPRPVGRHQELVPTPVEVWAKKQDISVLSFPSQNNMPWLYENEQEVIDALQPFKPDLLVSASYGQKIPTQTIMEATYGGLNVHPSLLPRWRGADPVPWAIVSGDNQTGVTIVTLSEHFDEGKIIAQKKIPILLTDTTTLLYPKLFSLGADLLVEMLPAYLSQKQKGEPQGQSLTPYARRLTKQDGFVEWNVVQAAIGGKGAEIIDRKFRALTPWPGLWTTIFVRGKAMRLKILTLYLKEHQLVIDSVQLEGKQPVPFPQFSSAYLSP